MLPNLRNDFHDFEPNEWEIVRIPAIAESQEERDAINKLYGLPIGLPDILGRKEVEPLCPSRFSKELLEQKRKKSIFSFSAQFQGNPVLKEGNLFKYEWFKFCKNEELINSKKRDKNLIRIRYWDKAGTQDGGDYTAGALICYDVLKDELYIEDVVYGQWGISKRNEIILQTLKKDNNKYGEFVVYNWQEQGPGADGKEAAGILASQLLKSGFKIEAEKPTANKEYRSELEPYGKDYYYDFTIR